MHVTKEFLLAAALMIVAGVLIPFLKATLTKAPPHLLDHSEKGVDLARLLYGFFVVVLVFTPAASFVIATKLDLEAAVFLLMGMGVLLSLPFTLLVARLVSADQHETYWRYLEDSSKVGRRAILLMWLGVTLMTLGIGFAQLFS